MVDFVIIMFAVVGLIVLAAIVSLCHSNFKLFSSLFQWYQKTHPEVSKTASGHLIRVVQGSVLSEYKLSKDVLGKGASGVVRSGVNIMSKKNYAIKTVELKDDHVAEFYKREIDILKDLEHLNIIRVFEAFEETGSLGLVMELCTGGHLGEVVVDSPNGRLDEGHAQRYVCQLVSALSHCHQHGICHRDIKLQNVLLETRTFDAQVKLIDFGNAKRFSTSVEGEAEKAPFRSIAGTTYTMAPEVFKKEYDERCDVWSLGVVSFIMLCGHKPFESIDLPGNHVDISQSSLVSNIMMGRYSFQHPAWEFISEGAMLFIMSCFTMNYKKRPSAAQLFQEKWCAPHNINNELPTTKLKKYTRKLSRIPSQSLSQTSMIAVAFAMPSTDARDLRSVFQSIDKDGNGKVDRAEFWAYLHIAEPKMTEQEASTLFDAIDQDGNQEISFLEFVASMVDSRTVNIGEINQAFHLLDQEGKGYISHSDLYRLLAANNNTPKPPPPLMGRDGSSSVESTSSAGSLSKIALMPLSSFSPRRYETSSPVNRPPDSSESPSSPLSPQSVDVEQARLEKLQRKVKSIIDEADQNGDGKISYAEFLLAMSSGSSPILPPNTSPHPLPFPKHVTSTSSSPLSPGRHSPGQCNSTPHSPLHTHRPGHHLQPLQHSPNASTHIRPSLSSSSFTFDNYDPKSMLLKSFSDETPIQQTCNVGTDSSIATCETPPIVGSL